MALFVLIHSPFVGALTWRPTARALEQRGHGAMVPTLDPVSAPYWPHYGDVVAEAVEAHRTNEPIVLVAHSAGGLVVPAVRAALRDREIRSYIFVDAAVPRSGASLCDLIPASLGIGIKEIRAQATAGVLPPWGAGWSDDVWRRLIPDAALRAQFTDELRPTPVALYEEPVSWSGAWPEAPCRYLRFSALYAEEEDTARQSGWATRELAGDHLHMLVRPGDVAECLNELA